MNTSPKIAVIGLGYVGLPLAVALSRRYHVTGFDIDSRRIEEIGSGHDRTGEVKDGVLRSVTTSFTAKSKDLAGADIYMVTVPTPVTKDNLPDLGPVRAACQTVGAVMTKGATVVFESTVYPGVTEDICGPLLAEASGLTCGQDFFLGYSPERINPGDREHTVDRITKVVAGQTPEVAKMLAEVYGSITSGGAFIARDIKTAEASKVIENAQRDINIAFVNEIATIFTALGLSVHDVLEASGTKWNFLNFKPGLVGGHCIGVDPFYLAHCAQKMGLNPNVILAGRKVNDGMAGFVAEEILRQIASGDTPEPALRFLILGLTFKEDVPDLRNTKVVDLAARLRQDGHHVDIHDPMADPQEARAHYGIELMTSLSDSGGYDCVVGAVSHSAYGSLTGDALTHLLKPNGLLADIKGLWRGMELPASLRYWQL
jgi:UDP-N-acetyl-D-glucosamine/UDP-N-acetyl-D-galactosamine dehydrogenase